MLQRGLHIPGYLPRPAQFLFNPVLPSSTSSFLLHCIFSLQWEVGVWEWMDAHFAIQDKVLFPLKQHPVGHRRVSSILGPRRQPLSGPQFESKVDLIDLRVRRDLNGHLVQGSLCVGLCPSFPGKCHPVPAGTSPEAGAPYLPRS